MKTSLSRSDLADETTIQKIERSSKNWKGHNEKQRRQEERRKKWRRQRRPQDQDYA